MSWLDKRLLAGKKISDASPYGLRFRASGGDQAFFLRDTGETYAVHIFNSSDNFALLETLDIEYLVVGGGGGGGVSNNNTNNQGGAGGGGRGGRFSGDAAGTGVVNTGGGGGGRSTNSPNLSTGGAGGSGVVIVRYKV